ncbi:hypothetical protein LQZ18_10720 [Lachnospiraceae bacterium ZAX-1]
MKTKFYMLVLSFVFANTIPVLASETSVVTSSLHTTVISSEDDSTHSIIIGNSYQRIPNILEIEAVSGQNDRIVIGAHNN